MEQPDTSVPDFVDLEDTMGACVREFTTDICVATSRESSFAYLVVTPRCLLFCLSFRRLWIRSSTNLTLQTPRSGIATGARGSDYPRHAPCAMLAGLCCEEFPGFSASGLPPTLIQRFIAVLWAAAGLPVKLDAINADGQLSSEVDRVFQKVRGVGGRKIQGGRSDAPLADA